MALVAISALPASTTIVSTDVLPFVRGGTTDKITAGNFRTQSFAFAAQDPLNCGILTAVGDSTITGKLSGITTITATNTASTTMVGDLLFTDATYDIGKTGATRPRDIFLSRALTVGTDVTITSTNGIIVGGQRIIALLSNGVGINGVATANVGLTIRGDRTSFDGLRLIDTNGAPYATWSVGIGSGGGGDLLGFYNVTASAQRMSLSAAGLLTTAAGAVLTGPVSGVTTLSLSSTLTMTSAASQIVPGVTSLSLRNNANNADNILITDAGNATLRGTLTFGSATAKILPTSGGSVDFRYASDAGSILLISDLNKSVQVSNGKLALTGGSASQAAFQLSSQTAPSSPVSGEFWYDGTNLKFRDGGTTRTLTWT